MLKIQETSVQKVSKIPKFKSINLCRFLATHSVPFPSLVARALGIANSSSREVGGIESGIE